MFSPDNEVLWRFYLADLTIRKLSEHTVANYRQTLGTFDAFLGKPFTEATKLDCMEYVADQQTRCAERTVHLRHVGLRVFYNFLVREELIAKSPMKDIPEPEIQDTPPPIPSEDDLRKILKVCSGTSFLDRRDTALFRIMAEPGGPRRAEVIGMTLEAVDYGNGVIRVLGKGKKTRYIPIGNRTSQALMRYLVARKKHKYGEDEALWLGRFGALTIHSLRMILRKRCKEAGIKNLHPHQIRHFAADRAMAAGITDQDMMTLFGWTTQQMLQIYGRANKDQRAIETAKRLALGDKL
jgi:site-specific recombinase XerD